MNAKKLSITFISISILLFLSSCAGLYVGGGGLYSLSGADAAAYESWSGEDIVFPKLDGGGGFFVELGSLEKDGTMSASFGATPMTGVFGAQTYPSVMYQITCGTRISLRGDDDDEDFPFIMMLPLNITYQWLNVSGSSSYGGVPGDTSFSGFGANAGLGAMAVIADYFLFNIEALWSFEIYGRADAEQSEGKIEEAPFVTGPVFKAGLYLLL